MAWRAGTTTAARIIAPRSTARSLAAHAPVFASLNPYQGALDRVRVNGRSKDGNQSFGTFTAAEPLVVTARPAESSNGSAVQFAVELTSFLVYTTTTRPVGPGPDRLRFVFAGRVQQQTHL
jgi:hypothetical protein